MSNTDDNSENSEDRTISFIIRKITQAQADLAVYTTILGQIYRAREQEADIALAKAKSEETIESIENTTVDSGHYVFATDGFTCHFEGPGVEEKERQRKASEERERLENAARIKFLSDKLEELQAKERQDQKDRTEEEEKQLANPKEPVGHPIGYKKSTSKQQRFRQAQEQAYAWAAERKPNNVWYSPANQKAIKDRRAKIVKQQYVAIRQAQFAASRVSRSEAKAANRAKQLDSIIEEFNRARHRAEILGSSSPSNPAIQDRPSDIEPERNPFEDEEY